MTDSATFLEALDPEAHTWTFQTFDDSKRRDLAATRHGTLEAFAPWLASQNAQGAGIFFTVNQTDGQGRRKAGNIRRVRAVFADFDTCDPDRFDMLMADRLPPSIVVESSPDKHHAYWLVDDLPMGEFKAIQQRIAADLGSDPTVNDLPRVMRLPGFNHMKGEPYPVKLLYCDPGQLYTRAQILDRWPEPEPTRTPPEPPVTRGNGYASAALRSACNAVRMAPEGQRNATLNREAFSIAQLVAGGVIDEGTAYAALTDAARAAGLSDGEIEATLKSAFSAGAQHPRGAGERQAHQHTSQGAPHMDESEPDAPPRFKLLSRADIRRLPELEWRVSDVLPMFGIGLIIGQSGAGKSFITIDLLARTSLGLPWFDHAARPCKTVYVALEGRAGIKRRIEAWERHHDVHVSDDFAVVLDTLKLTEQQDVHELARSILAAGGEGGLIVIDTLAQATPGIDENSSADMGVLIEALQRLQALTGGLVLAVHHMGKDTTRGARGHSSLYAACDVVLAVTSGAGGRSVNTNTSDGGKSKDAEPVTHDFELGSVLLHTMDNGKEIRGACVVPMESAPKVSLPKPPAGGNARIVWDHLGKLLRDAGDRRPPDAPASLPEGRPAIGLEEAIEQIGPKLTCEPKRRPERTRAAITSLVNSGRVCHSDGWLWCN